MKSVLSDKHFHDEAAAYRFVEARVWPEGPVCPHCGGYERIGKLEGKSTRIGVYKCYQCRKPFTVKVGTVFESSHVKLHLWLQAMFLMASSKKGISANQLHRTLGITLKSAWFVAHRLRLAMTQVGFEPMGGAGETVEIDETAIGRLDGVPKATGGYAHKNIVLSLVNRQTGEARSFHVANVSVADIIPIVKANVHPDTEVMTDEGRHYLRLGDHFAAHGSVNHGIGQYGLKIHGHTHTHTNTIEGFYSIFKRGMKGIYQHCGERHLHRYLAEFDFRYSNRVALGVNDEARASRLLKGIVGKRLTYRTTN